MHTEQVPDGTYLLGSGLDYRSDSNTQVSREGLAGM